MLIALDQGGRGKGDLIRSTESPRHYPNQQREPCFSWNNKYTDTNHVTGFASGMPTIHEGSDYINLGAGLAANLNPGPGSGGVSCQREWGHCLYPGICISASSGKRFHAYANCDSQSNLNSHGYGNSYGYTYVSLSWPARSITRMPSTLCTRSRMHSTPNANLSNAPIF